MKQSAVKHLYLAHAVSSPTWLTGEWQLFGSEFEGFDRQLRVGCVNSTTTPLHS